MKISLILDLTVEILRRGLEGNVAEEEEEGFEKRHGREVETEEEKEMVVVFARNGEAIGME